MEMVKKARSKKSSTEKTAPRKKARTDDVIEKKSYIYFLVRSNNCVEPRNWFVTELDNNNTTQEVDMQYPEVSAADVCFGSYGTLIYGFGGTEFVAFTASVKFLRSVFFYDTSNPKNGWIQGPRMIATRADYLGCTHRVVEGKLYVLSGVGYSSEDNQSNVTYPWGEFLDISSARNKCFGEWQPLGRPLKSKPDDDVEPYLYLGVNPSLLGSGKWDKLDPIPFDFASLPMLSGKFDPKRHILFHMGRYGMDIVVCYDVCKNLCFRFHGSFALRPYHAQKLIVEKDFVFAPTASYVFAAVLFGDHSSPPPPWFFGSVQDMYRTRERLPTPPRPFEMEGTGRFQLLRIAPCKYATLWYDNDKDKLRLSIFSVSLDSPPFEKGGIRFLPAETHVADEHVDLGLQPNGRLEIVAAVAV